MIDEKSLHRGMVKQPALTVVYACGCQTINEPLYQFCQRHGETVKYSFRKGGLFDPLGNSNGKKD